MLKSSSGPPPKSPAADTKASERRIDPRYDFTGARMRLLVAGVPHVLQLKDMSCTGVCGLTDAPIRLGQTILLHLDGFELIPMRICWIRRTFFGAAFEEPMDPQVMKKLRRCSSLRCKA